MMPGAQFLPPTVYCPGCGELIYFHPEEWFRRMAKYCATCGALNESEWHQYQRGPELWCCACGTEHTYDEGCYEMTSYEARLLWTTLSVENRDRILRWLDAREEMTLRESAGYWLSANEWEENDDEAADIVRGLAQLLRSAAPFKQLPKEDES